jgi:calcineurin-binding protein cabin-1
VLRAIRKHFPQPPYDLFVNNPIDNFLDGPDSCEKILSEICESNESREAILNVLFPGERGYEAFKKLCTVRLACVLHLESLLYDLTQNYWYVYLTTCSIVWCSSEPYSDVYENLYYYIAQAEDISATDKHAGFVLKKEGEEFIEQSANIFKYDLLYNPLRFESWQKLSNLYDEVVSFYLYQLIGSVFLYQSILMHNQCFYDRKLICC